MVTTASSQPLPERPEQLHVTVEESADAITICKQKRQLAGGCFLGVWLSGWTIGCVFLAVAVVTKPEPFMMLFAVPFWASWLFVAALLSAMLFQREDIVLDSDGLLYTWRVLVPLHQRAIPVEELVRIECSESTNFEENDSPVAYVEVVGRGRPLLMLSHLPEADRRWVAAVLDRRLGEIQSRRSPPGYGVSQRAVDPPSDCSWSLEEDYDGATFSQRGRIAPLPLFLMLFLCLFWNGIVSVFALSLLGVAPGGPVLHSHEWWKLFYFLIPFVLIGLILSGLLLMIVLDPLRRVTWKFNRQEIQCRWSWIGLGRTYRYDAMRVGTIEQKIEKGSGGASFLPWNSWVLTTASQRVILRLLDEHGTELTSLKGITLGEAEWMRSRIAPFYGTAVAGDPHRH